MTIQFLEDLLVVILRLGIAWQLGEEPSEGQRLETRGNLGRGSQLPPQQFLPFAPLFSFKSCAWSPLWKSLRAERLSAGAGS